MTPTGSQPTPQRRGSLPPLLAFLAAVATIFLALPLVGLLTRVSWSDLTTHLLRPQSLEAARLSLVTSFAAAGLSLLAGVPLAWLLARVTFPGHSIVRALAIVPLVLPPVVGGVALLSALGQVGFIGRSLESALGVRFFGTTAAAILAATFVAMPFLVLTVEGAIRSLDERLEDAAETLGAEGWTVFRRVTLPLVAPALRAGTVLAWARALGEFGATITFAGDVPGATRTLPLAIYAELDQDTAGALSLSLVLVAISLVVVVLLRERWWPAR